MNPEELTVALAVNDQKKVHIADRQTVPLNSGRRSCFWEAPLLREMFRGNRVPPPDSEMDHYPPEYTDLFYIVENQALLLCDVMGDRTDQEFEEIYSMLRRRPDGKSLGPAHDFFWQVAAGMLGMYQVSAAEHDAIFGQLARSARHWALRPVSRNYIAYLRNTLDGARRGDD